VAGIRARFYKLVAVLIIWSVVCLERRTARGFNKTERVSLARTISTGSKLARLCPDYAVLKQQRGLWSRGMIPTWSFLTGAAARIDRRPRFTGRVVVSFANARVPIINCTNLI